MMGELDDLDEIDMSAAKSGSARRARQSKKNMATCFARALARPLWKRQLRGVRGYRTRLANQRVTNG